MTPTLWALPALGLAAGLDLYLTLLVLGVASLSGLPADLPGAIGDLDSAGVMVMVGIFYLAELAAERRFVSSLVWNALHAIIRPLAGALLALLVLDGAGGLMVVAGVVGTTAIASLAHATSSGGSFLLWLTPGARVRPLLADLLEDAAVLGLVVLTLDRPRWGAVAAGLLVLGALVRARSNLVSFRFGLRLLHEGAARWIYGRGGWIPGPRLPAWVRTSVDQGHDPVPERLRGTRGALVGDRAPKPILDGWLVVGEPAPCFVHRGGTPVEIEGPDRVTLHGTGLIRTLAREESPTLALHLPIRGPRAPALLDALRSRPG